MTRYVYREGLGVIEAERAPPRQLTPYVQSDLKPFKSPLEGHPVIDGRRALREELARNNCRLVDPTEHRAVYKNPSFALKRGLPLDGAN